MEENKVDKEVKKLALIAYAGLFFGIVGLGLSGWILYKEVNKPKATSDKVDAFFQQQDQEFDKLFKDEE